MMSLHQLPLPTSVRQLLSSVVVAFAASSLAHADCSLPRSAQFAAADRANTLMAAYIDDVEERMDVKAQYGLSVAVSVCGAAVWSASYGFADLENQVPVDEDTRFRVGSVSKTLTATALAQLAEQGQLDLDAEVQTYVPDFPKKAWPVTVRQVAGHLGGIRHYEGDEFFSADAYASVNDGLAIFADDPLVHQPGSAFLYSTYGWNLPSPGYTSE
jgi:serine beta-lactamase-like protein LACTB